MANWNTLFKEQGKVFVEIQEDVRRVSKLLKKEKVKKVLDLGCGSGRHTVFLAKQGFDVYAMDISDEGLRLTGKWLKELKLKAKIKKASFYKKFPYKTNFFDAIVSTQAIHHNVRNKVKFCISEIERVLKPNGILFVSVSADKHKRGATKFKLIEPRTYIPLDGEEKGVPHYIYSKNTLKEDFKDFKIIKIYTDEHPHWCVLGKLYTTLK